MILNDQAKDEKTLSKVLMLPSSVPSKGEKWEIWEGFWQSYEIRTGQIMLIPIKNIEYFISNSLLFPKPVNSTKLRHFLFKEIKTFGHFRNCQNLKGNTAS